MATTAHFTDEQIIALYFERDETAIAETDRKYGSYLLTIAHNILQNLPDSEECRNDTYLRVWNDIPPTRPRAFAAYLAKIIRGLSINRLKFNHRAKRVPPEVTASFADLEDVLPDRTDAEWESKEIARVIEAFLQTLSARKRYVFMCRYFALFPTAEIATKLGISESAVRKALASMKNDLRALLKKEGITV